MTRYYYGIIEFGDFVMDGDTFPMAIIRRVDEVKEFDDPQLAWEYYTLGEFDSYVATNAKDADGDQYEIVFKTRSA